MLLSLIWILQVISSVLLIVLILLHSPKGDGIAAIGGASNVLITKECRKGFE